MTSSSTAAWRSVTARYATDEATVYSQWQRCLEIGPAWRRSSRWSARSPAHELLEPGARLVTITRDPRPSWATVEGLATPLGATWIAEEEAWDFAVYSEHGEAVTLLLYAEQDTATPILTQQLDHLRNKSGPVW